MAKKDVSAVVSGMGVGLSILTSIVEKAKKRGLGDDVIHQLATPQGDALLDKFIDLMAGAGPNAANLYPVTVNYDQTLEDMIAAGKYDWKNSDINTRNFPVEGKGKQEVNLELIHFDRTMESDQVLAELGKRGLRPATLVELLAFGAKYPEMQREFPIVALGSVWRDCYGRRNVPCLRSHSSGRNLNLYWFGFRWDALHRFAAVRK